MTPVAVRIFHVQPGPADGPLARWLAAARQAMATRQAEAFRSAGADEVGIVAGTPDDTPFGARLRALVRNERPRGLVVLGSGAIPLARPRDRRAFVEAAAATKPIALANDRFSADIIAMADPARLADLPDLPSDNGLPRWLAESAGVTVGDLKRRWHLGFDLDGPLDLVLAGWAGLRVEPPDAGIDLSAVLDRLAAVASVTSNQQAELVLAGRISAKGLAWVERSTASRTRALMEERGLRTSLPGQRPPASVLGALLERDGPASLGDHLARLGDAALLDSRVLLAHRLGPDERAWPSPEDRFASDLLLADRIGDRWLAALTRSAAAAPIPVVLGGHSLVGPGLRLALRPPARAA